MPTAAIRVAQVALLITIVGCAKDQNPAPKGADSGAAVNAAGKAAPPAGSPAPKQGRARADSGPPFERMAGYVVRGTDESSFRRCGSNRTHFIRVTADSWPAILQRYRFRAPVPLSPVYYVFHARVIEDTVVVGDYTYTSSVEVRRVFPEQPDSQPECPAPMRGSMIADR